LASTHLRLLLVDYAGSSSPTSLVVTIADNHLHQQNSITSPPLPLMVNIKRRQDLLLLLLATPRNFKQKIRV
jgi:hypothetical protein